MRRLNFNVLVHIVEEILLKQKTVTKTKEEKLKIIKWNILDVGKKSEKHDPRVIQTLQILELKERNISLGGTTAVIIERRNIFLDNEGTWILKKIVILMSFLMDMYL